jgi:hypothetical protein
MASPADRSSPTSSLGEQLALEVVDAFFLWRSVE